MSGLNEPTPSQEMDQNDLVTSKKKVHVIYIAIHVYTVHQLHPKVPSSPHVSAAVYPATIRPVRKGGSGGSIETP